MILLEAIRIISLFLILDISIVRILTLVIDSVGAVAVAIALSGAVAVAVAIEVFVPLLSLVLLSLLRL